LFFKRKNLTKAAKKTRNLLLFQTKNTKNFYLSIFKAYQKKNTKRKFVDGI